MSGLSRSDKQKIAKVFEVTAGLDEIEFDPGDDLRPQSMRPVVYMNDAGERQIKMMRWGFKLPDHLLFNAHSEGIAQSSFWHDAFLTCLAIAPGDALYEWKEAPKDRRNPSMSSRFRGRSRPAWWQFGND